MQHEAGSRAVRLLVIALTLVVTMVPAQTYGLAQQPRGRAGAAGNASPEVIDRQAIETTLVRYSTGLDTFDADVYA